MSSHCPNSHSVIVDAGIRPEVIVIVYEQCRENLLFAYAKTKTQISFAVTAKLISAFVFATWILQYIFFLNPNFQVSSNCAARIVSDLVGNSKDRFSHVAAHILCDNNGLLVSEIFKLKKNECKRSHTRTDAGSITYYKLIL